MDLITQRVQISEIGLPEWAQEIAKKNNSSTLVRKGLAPSDTQFSEGERASVDYITTKSVDRDGEIVLPQGALLDEYRKHPIVLWAHKYDELGLGRNMWIKTDSKGLIAKTEYATHPKAQEVYEYRKAGFPLAKSIGFIPLEAIEQKDFNSVDFKSLGLDPEEAKSAKRIYTKWLLLEYSDVPIPSNPGALQIAISKGLVTEKEAVKLFGPWNSKGECIAENLPWIEERYGKGTSRKKDIDIEEGEKMETITKPETTDNYHRVPVPGEQGKHDGHKIRTIDISKKQGIKALYCVDCKKIITYMFDVNKWSMQEAQQWVRDHAKKEKQEIEIEKTICGSRTLPLDQTGTWDDTAKERVRKWAGGPKKENIDWNKYGKAFVYVDPKKRNDFGGYKLLFADVVGGKLKAIRGGVIVSMRYVLGARGGVSMPEADRKACYNFLVSYYKRFGMEPPEYKKPSRVDEVLKEIDVTKFKEVEEKHKERINPKVSKVFDVEAVEVPAGSFVYELYAKYLRCKIKDVYSNNFLISMPLLGTYLSAYKNVVLDEVKVLDIRNFLSAGMEAPLEYETIQLKSDLSEEFLIKGMVFAELKDETPVIIRYQPTWSGMIVSIVTDSKNREWNGKALKKVKQWAKENNYLRGEKFELSGEFVEKSEEGWEDLIIDRSLEKVLKSSIKTFNKAGTTLRSRGLLLIGPPGTGKTLTGKVLKNNTDHTFIWVTSKVLGKLGSVRGISMAYDLARDLAPSIVFMEDIDSWLGGMVIDVLKTEMDGLKANRGVMTILTSNHPEQLPSALLDRPGRFHDVLNYDYPDEGTRERMFNKWIPDELDEGIVEELVKMTEGYSGAHLKELIEFAETLMEDEEGWSMEDALFASLEKMSEQQDLISSIQSKEVEEKVIETKAGRVLSEKNRTLISEAIGRMKTAIGALENLLKATENTPTSTPGKEAAREELEQLVRELKEPKEQTDLSTLNREEIKSVFSETLSTVCEELKQVYSETIKEKMLLEYNRAKGKVVYN